MNDEKKKELWRTVKFTLFSISAGVIQFATTALMTEVFHTPTWIAYLTGLVLSVIWNFTLNRRYTFKSANNVPKAMLLVLLFYLVFTPVSTVLVGMLTEGIALPWDETRILVKGWELVHPLIGTLIGMVLNFVTEFLYDRFVVFKDSLDTNDIAAKEEAAAVQEAEELARGAEKVPEKQERQHNMSNEKKTGFWPVFKEILRVFLFVFVIPFVTAALCMILWLVLSETTLRFDTEHLALLAILPLTVGAYFLFRKALRPYIFWVKTGIALAMLIAVTVMLLISRGNPQGTVFYYGGQWLLVPYFPLLLLVLAVNLLEVLCVTVGAEALGALMSALILKLKPGKKWVIGLGATCAVLAAVIGLSYANGPQFRYKGHDFDYMHGYSSTDFTDFTVYAEHSKLVTLSEPATLSIENPDEMPVLDGAEACYPVYAALAKAVYQGIDKIEAEAWERDSFPNGHIVQFTNTVQAFYRLIDGEVDMFFGSNPSKDQMEYAEYAGVELEITPIGKEGFVFFVEADNPVSGLTSDQIRAIYHGDITNWAEVGGKDREIVAFQRPQNSGSQTRMLSFMGDVTLKEPVGYEVVSAMLGVITEVAEYANEAGAMGYTFRYFLEGLNQEKGVKILAVDGVYPTPATIADGSYPLTGSLCLVTRKNDPNPNVQKMIDFILSEQGQEIVEKTGYGRINN